MCNTEAAAHQQQQRVRDNDRAKATSIDGVAGGLSATAAPPADGYVRVDPGCRLKKASELWHIHGKRFDLSGFVKHHPGGSSILEAVRGAEDVTALFESYHALANTEDIRQRLRKFEWTGKVLDDVSEREAELVGGKRKQLIRYRWDESGFYAVLKARVKRYFLEKHGQRGVDPEKASVNRFVKAPLSWYVKEVIIVAIYVPMFVYMLGYDMLRLGGASVSGWARAAFAVLAGAVLQAFSFCTLHDASHYGLWFKRPRAQEVLSRVCNAWTLWHHGLWVMHHVYGHHSFTGDPERDPDLVHARPYLRKSVLTPKEQYDPILVRWQRFLAPLFMMVLPGATLGQTQAYVRAAHVGHLWHVSITEASVGTRWYEYLTYFLALGSHILAGNFWVSFCYFMGISVAYHLCVAPDHDTFESSIVNSIETKRKNKVSSNNNNSSNDSNSNNSRSSNDSSSNSNNNSSSSSNNSNNSRNNSSNSSSNNSSSSNNNSSNSSNGSSNNSSSSNNNSSNSSNGSSSNSSSNNSSNGSSNNNSSNGSSSNSSSNNSSNGSSSNSSSNNSSNGSSNNNNNNSPDSGLEALEPRRQRRESNQCIECGSSRGRCSSPLLREERAAANGRASINGEGVSVMGSGGCHSEPPQNVMEKEKREEENDDWGEVQVRHSGNFSNGNYFVTQAMGGINYQIEHHLFPSVSHMLYDEIAPIVRETCREFCIPYNSHPTLWSAYKSYLKHLMVCSDLTDRAPQESTIHTQ